MKSDHGLNKDINKNPSGLLLYTINCVIQKLHKLRLSKKQAEEFN